MFYRALQGLSNGVQGYQIRFKLTELFNFELKKFDKKAKISSVHKERLLLSFVQRTRLSACVCVCMNFKVKRTLALKILRVENFIMRPGKHTKNVFIRPTKKTFK
jgi:hypothetical protein